MSRSSSKISDGYYVSAYPIPTFDADLDVSKAFGFSPEIEKSRSFRLAAASNYIVSTDLKLYLSLLVSRSKGVYNYAIYCSI